MTWRIRNQLLTFSRPLVMGIVNVTPDSFSDGGRFIDSQHAVDHAMKLVNDGADILDIGGESTRPGATPVPLDEELRRIVPVIREVAKQTRIPISIDTMKAAVAEAAIEEGAAIVNDVRGLRDAEMVQVCRKSQVGVVVMHMQGTPQTMQVNPNYVDVVGDTVNELRLRIFELENAGILPEYISIDPGIGFGKTLEQTLSQLNRLGEYATLGRPICLGVSRKGFLGQITGRDRAGRLAGTLAVNCYAVAGGSGQILRVHDVAEHRDAVKIWEAISSNPSTKKESAIM